MPHAGLIIDPDVQLALRLADRAAAVTLPLFRSAALSAAVKPGEPLLAEAAAACQQALQAAVQAKSPGDQFLGEEGSPQPQAACAGRRWIAGPVVGAQQFAAGHPAWMTLIALQEDGVTAAAVADAPALGVRWAAGRGLGAARLAAGSVPRMLSASRLEDLQAGVLAHGGLRPWADRGAERQLMGLASQCAGTIAHPEPFGFLAVAEGWCQAAAVPHAHLWDVAAPALIVREAGGVITRLDGSVIGAGAGSALASCSAGLHESAVAAARP